MILKHNKAYITVIRSESLIREQMSGPDLHVFTLKFLAPQKSVFSCFRGQKKNSKKGYNATLQCGRYSVFPQNPKTLKT